MGHACPVFKRKMTISGKERVIEYRDLAHLRLSHLIDQLGDEMNFQRGWQKRVADRFEMSPAYFNRVYLGQKTISWSKFEEIAKAVGTNATVFFTEPGIEAGRRELIAAGGEGWDVNRIEPGPYWYYREPPAHSALNANVRVASLEAAAELLRSAGFLVRSTTPVPGGFAIVIDVPTAYRAKATDR